MEEKKMSESKENTTVAKVEENKFGFGAFRSVKNDNSELMDVNASDIQLPKIKLLQNTSQEVVQKKGAPGEFYNTVTGKSVAELPCIILSQSKMMTMWNTPFKRGEDPLCRSYDAAKKSDPDGKGDGICATCQYSSQNPSAWKEAKGKGLNHPECMQSYAFLMKTAAETGSEAPFRLICSGSSVAAAKKIISNIASMNVAPFCCKVTLKSTLQQNDSGAFYVINFADFRPNDELLDENGQVIQEKYEKINDMAISLRGFFMTSGLAEADVVDEPDVSDDGSEAGALF